MNRDRQTTASDKDDDNERDEQERIWGTFFDALNALLGRFGTADWLGRGDFLIVDDNYGYRRSQVEIHKLDMLRPEIIRELQGLVADHTDWEITVTVDIPGTEGRWPPMGLTIRAHETIDGLRREYLSEPYRSYSYERSRSGTGYD